VTCIVGFTDGPNVVIGGDSAGIAGYDLSVRADQKVFRNGDFIMGFTSSFRMGQLLRYKFNPPKRYPEQDVYAYMVTDFIDRVRSCFKDGGYATTKDSAEHGGTFLVGYAGRLFRVDSDYQVGENTVPYDACGCGEAYALGAINALHRYDKDLAPKEYVLYGLSAAEDSSAGVRGPFHVEELARETKEAA
jgi:ATP-dependent protease HslVU (ClpYQ) peptidase subunit